MANNKMREALVKAQTALVICEWPDGTRMEGVAELLRQIDAALAEPARNCDSGTADEQLEQFIKKWESVGYGKIDERSIRMMSIFSRWAQMPYKEGGNNGR